MSSQAGFDVMVGLVFSVVALQLLFPMNDFLPLDRRASTLLGAVACMIIFYAFPQGDSINIGGFVDFDVLIVLTAIMVINFVILRQDYLNKMVMRMQDVIRQDVHRGFYLVSIISFLVSPVIMNDGLCLMLVHPVLDAFLNTPAHQKSPDKTDDSPRLPLKDGDRHTLTLQDVEEGEAADRPVEIVNDKAPAPTDPFFFLLNIACSANIGSSLTFSGNPQNLIVAQFLSKYLNGGAFFALMLVPTLISWFISLWYINHLRLLARKYPERGLPDCSGAVNAVQYVGNRILQSLVDFVNGDDLNKHKSASTVDHTTTKKSPKRSNKNNRKELSWGYEVAGENRHDNEIERGIEMQQASQQLSPDVIYEASSPMSSAASISSFSPSSTPSTSAADKVTKKGQKKRVQIASHEALVIREHDPADDAEDEEEEEDETRFRKHNAHVLLKLKIVDEDANKGRDQEVHEIEHSLSNHSPSSVSSSSVSTTIHQRKKQTPTSSSVALKDDADDADRSSAHSASHSDSQAEILEGARAISHRGAFKATCIALILLIALEFVGTFSLTGLFAVTAMTLLVSLLVGGYYYELWSHYSLINKSNLESEAVAGGRDDDLEEAAKREQTTEQRLQLQQQELKAKRQSLKADIAQSLETLFHLELDYNLLIIFTGLFVVSGAFVQTQLPRELWNVLSGGPNAAFQTASSIIVIIIYIVVSSQLVSGTDLCWLDCFVQTMHLSSCIFHVCFLVCDLFTLHLFTRRLHLQPVSICIVSQNSLCLLSFHPPFSVICS